MPDSSPQSAYLLAQRQHLAECAQDLADLRTILQQRQWSRLERHAAERTLQILIEACIGLAKHWARSETGMVCRDAVTGFERLRDAGKVDSDMPWRKIIGLRNVLVHDYLDVDPEIVKSVIDHQHYRTMIDFGHQALAALERRSPGSTRLKGLERLKAAPAGSPRAAALCRTPPRRPAPGPGRRSGVAYRGGLQAFAGRRCPPRSDRPAALRPPPR